MSRFLYLSLVSNKRYVISQQITLKIKETKDQLKDKSVHILNTAIGLSHEQDRLERNRLTDIKKGSQEW